MHTTTRPHPAGQVVLDAVDGAERRPSWLPHDRYPFTLRAVGADEDLVAYTDSGRGPTLLFVHVGMWSFVWRDLIADLSATHRCVALDAPATGLSGGHPRTRATIECAAAAVTRVVEALDLSGVTLVVHDLGGPTALLAARRWPSRITGLVVVNSFGWRPSGLPFRGMLALMGSAAVRGLDVATGVLPRLSSGRFGVGRQMDRADRRIFRRGVGRRGRSSFHRYLRDARRIDAGPIESGLAALRDRPLLTIFGARNDPLGFQPRWAERCPDIRQVEVPNAFHFPMCDAPDLVASTIRGWHARVAAPGTAEPG
jgi:pimeloyl-ACP methyl ester carboxylesterase